MKTDEVRARARGASPCAAVTVRLPKELAEQIEVWAKKFKLRRSQAVRDLIGLGLKR
jgi:metal-responsive CopG/Arc/MetJ family transcriptional regulator